MKPEKVNFKNTLKINIQLTFINIQINSTAKTLIQQYNGTKGTKQIQNNETNIEQKNGLSIRFSSMEDVGRIENIYSLPIVA